MSLNIGAVIDAVRSVAMASGMFERTVAHEPKNAPGTGITWACWVDTIEPLPGGSGLATTTARIVFVVRLYSPMLAEPQDGIDPALTGATVGLMTSYSADYDLGGLVRNIDLLGEGGVPLSSRAGYLNQSGTLYRIYDITLPFIVNDVWTQAA